MSVHRGRSEVTGGRSERRNWHFRTSSFWANVRFAPAAGNSQFECYGTIDVPSTIGLRFESLRARQQNKILSGRQRVPVLCRGNPRETSAGVSSPSRNRQKNNCEKPSVPGPARLAAAVRLIGETSNKPSRRSLQERRDEFLPSYRTKMVSVFCGGHASIQRKNSGVGHDTRCVR
jgi:hypothetical protein